MEPQDRSDAPSPGRTRVARWGVGRKKRLKIVRRAGAATSALLAVVVLMVIFVPAKGSVRGCTIRAIVKERQGRRIVAREQYVVHVFALAGWQMREHKPAALIGAAAVLAGVVLLHLGYRGKPGQYKMILTADILMGLTASIFFTMWLLETLDLMKVLG